MKKTIWKYGLQDAFSPAGVRLPLPEGARVLTVQVQPGNGAQLWAEVHSEIQGPPRTFKIFGTGHEIPDNAKYIATWQDTPFVWHLYELDAKEGK